MITFLRYVHGVSLDKRPERHRVERRDWSEGVGTRFGVGVVIGQHVHCLCLSGMTFDSVYSFIKRTIDFVRRIIRSRFTSIENLLGLVSKYPSLLVGRNS